MSANNASEALVRISKVDASVLMKIIETTTEEFTPDEKVALKRLRKEFSDVLKFWAKIESLTIKKKQPLLEQIVEEAQKLEEPTKLVNALNNIREQNVNKPRKVVKGEAGKRILNRKGIK